jgi:diacylglycerol kinase family enzyme
MPPAAVTVIVNKGSGSSTDQSRAAIEAALARANLRAQIVAVAGSEIQAAAERAAGAGDTLVAAGGDGTVSTVAAIAVKHRSIFGVIPLGTLNHFAKDAGIPLDIDAAVAAIAAGRTAPLDTGELNGRTFVNNASIGVYANMVRERQLEQRRGRGKWPAFAIGLARTFSNYRQITVRMTVDGQPLVRRTPFVFIGNGEYFAEGVALGRRTSLTTGRLWISLAPECSRAEMLILITRAIAGRLTPDVKLEEFRAVELTIESRARDAGLAMDGELAGSRPPLRCACRPGTLRTILPG